MNISLFLLAISVFVGIFIPSLAAMFSPFLFHSLFGIMLFALMQIDLLSLKDKIQTHLSTSLRVMALQMVGLPICIMGLIWLFDFESSFSRNLLLVACAGSVFGTPAFVGLLGFDRSLALMGVVISNAMLPLTMIVALMWFLPEADGQRTTFDFQSYLFRIGVFIVGPFSIALAYRKWFRPTFAQSHDGYLRVAVLAALMFFAIAIMDGVMATWRDDPLLALTLFVQVMVIHGVFYLLPFFVFRSSGREISTTAGMLSAYRNLGLVIAIAGPALPPDFFIFVGLWQIPMYLSPLLLGFLFRTKPGQ